MTNSPKLSLETIAQLSQGELRCEDSALLISEISTDSRGAFARHSLFIALTGEHFDGHEFVENAYKKGAAAAMVSRSADIDSLAIPGMALIIVDDTLGALQRLAAGWRALFDIPVVGITGSNGKTVVKDMLANMLAQEHTVYRSPGSYNSQVGVAISLLGIRPEHEIAIIEAGISRVGEMARLEKMVRPTLGIITNIGLAHAAGLGDLETTAAEKVKLFEGLGDGVLIFPEDCPPLDPLELPGRQLSFSSDTEASDAAYSIVASRDSGHGFDFEAQLEERGVHPFQLHVLGRHNLSNAMAAIAAADQLGLDVESMRRGLAAFELSPLRLEMHTTQSGITFINDAYNSDPTSARAALSVLKDYAGSARSVAILGDMLDLGSRAKAAHAQLGRIVNDTGVDLLICVGALAEVVGESAVAAGLPPEAVVFIDSIDGLDSVLDDQLVAGDVVLFKASRNIGLERAAERLLESVAPARLRVDLDAIRHNFHALRRQIGAETGVIAVVKSFAYGNDSTRVSQTLAREGVSALAVAYADEGIPLRRRGLTLPILVTNALASEADKIVKYRLTPFVYSSSVVEALAEQIRRRRERAEVHGIGVHLEVDTGMNRVGLKPNEILEFAKLVQRTEGVSIAGIMTHLAAADDPCEDTFTLQQISHFEQAIETLKQANIDPGIRHVANTAGAWRFPQARFDAVRVGLGTYGIAPSKAVGAESPGLRNALEFSTRIIHIKELNPGESVGYNRTWVADSARKIATIAVGYNDGFPRFMSNGGEVLIGGTRCPVVGTVCMDVSMVDITDVDDAKVGDEVIIFGAQGGRSISVDEIASRGKTISYELLCNISPRVRRIFVRQ
ncbi:alanine racemase [Bradymonas sediminis]|uniref:Multifunctional fusion protein n=1 Tax=Bradymonas sediminis TaxID=1548548 RepID=A0A2Z4FPX1_9DELT|nr:alanine racemase [Bradymonas sediminis]AWV90960.1 alanine racemase [Bradymonas sediminis]TDP75303.1 UDP-N-acetylmuramoyl-tripeptide--D-alanyl-D-alanine ligase [Bradymonas sediminis]